MGGCGQEIFASGPRKFSGSNFAIACQSNWDALAKVTLHVGTSSVAVAVSWPSSSCAAKFVIVSVGAAQTPAQRTAAVSSGSEFNVPSRALHARRNGCRFVQKPQAAAVLVGALAGAVSVASARKSRAPNHGVFTAAAAARNQTVMECRSRASPASVSRNCGSP